MSSNDIDALPPLREVIARHDLRATKTLGQNFLLDLNLTGKIARAAGALDGRTVIEIGPGPGGLTRALLKSTAREVIAIEYDPRCVAALQDLREAAAERLTILQQDALKTDIAILGHAPRVVVANLPYNIATPLLIGWLRQIHNPLPSGRGELASIPLAIGDNCFESLTLMFQQEVAERIVAPPGSKTYGRLSVMTQWLCDAKILFDIGPQAFTPPPKIRSAVVQLIPHARPAEVSFAAMEKVVAAAFGQRRKMLRSALKVLGSSSDAILEQAGIDPTERAENLPVEAFIQMAQVYTELLLPLL